MKLSQGRFLGGTLPLSRLRCNGSREFASTPLTLSVTYGVIPCSFFHSFSGPRQQASASSTKIDPAKRIPSSENTKKEMVWVSASVRGNDTGDALQTCITEIKEKRKRKLKQLEGTTSSIPNIKQQAQQQQQPQSKGRSLCEGEGEDAVDLCIVHFSDEHLWRLDLVKDVLLQIFEPKVLIGCSAAGVIGGGEELEQDPTLPSGLKEEYKEALTYHVPKGLLSVTTASLPGVELMPFVTHANKIVLPELKSDNVTIEQMVLNKNPHFLMLADPAFRVESFLRILDSAFPKGNKVGGMASGQTNGSSFILNNEIYRSKYGDPTSSLVVGVAMQGNIAVEAVVAQGCKPIGDEEPFTVTASQKNTVVQLDGRRPIDILRQLYPTLSEQDKELVAKSLFLGLQVGEEKMDYLIRTLLFDRESGMMAVGCDEVFEGQKVKFFTRDASSSSQDLRDQILRKIQEIAGTGSEKLENEKEKEKEKKERRRLEDVKGCLMYSCLGRGTGLFGQSNHDSNVCRELLSNKELDISGFFCNGEIGPVAGSTHLHGYTSAMALFFPCNSG